MDSKHCTIFDQIEEPDSFSRNENFGFDDGGGSDKTSNKIRWKPSNPLLHHDPNYSDEFDPYVIVILSQLWKLTIHPFKKMFGLSGERFEYQNVLLLFLESPEAKYRFDLMKNVANEK